MPLAAGTRLGPYEIVSPLGAGGMGEVYKARDTRLERTVAVKVSKESFEERFRNEALAVAALNHPHICTLFDVGPDYLVMEYVEGTAAAGPSAVAGSLAPGRTDRRRPRARPPPRHRPPRPQALEHPAHQERGQGPRLRPGQAPVDRAGDGRESPDADRGAERSWARRGTWPRSRSTEGRPTSVRTSSRSDWSSTRC